MERQRLPIGLVGAPGGTRSVDGYDEIRMQVDRSGHVLGLVVIHDVGGVKESVRPLDVGPFDSPSDALATAEPYLTKQMTLW